MPLHAALHHVTHYRYDRPVQLGPQVVRLRPAPHSRSKVVAYTLAVEPAGHFVNWQQDPFANYMARLVFPERTREFKVTVDLVVEMAVYNPFDFFLEPEAEKFPFAYNPQQQDELAPYLATEPLTPMLAQWVASIDRTPTPTINFLVGLNQRVQHAVRYLIRMEPGVQTPEETLAAGSGSCRDSGWLLVQLLRHLGLAARFVSGYLIQLAPDVKSLDGPSGTTVDFTDLHAWCEVYLPGAGWVGLDATSGLLAGEGHIPLACTPQPSSAAPIEGVVEFAEVTFSHEMVVSRLAESPRVTKPYSEQQWQAVLALGDAVDAELVANDVRLTMGGEPTFVAATDRDGAEWNTAAMGPTKRGYATALTHKLRDEYGKGGFLHFGQGKWYPGEQLPRWALSICWRTDGQPTWRNPALFADDSVPTHYTGADAERFVRALAAQLNVAHDTVVPGYEDVWYYLWRERKLPVNVDPFDARLDDELERARLRRVFTQRLDTVIGYVLPLKPTDETLPDGVASTWATGRWHFRDGNLYLIPGDSPMGYRLPLDALPWVAPADAPRHIERDPTEARGALGLPGNLVEARATVEAARAAELEATAARAAELETEPARFASAAEAVRTALCVEARDPRRGNGADAEAVGEMSGALYVFMPPLPRLEDYLALVAAVERTAERLGVRITLEGYPPPRDPRLQLLQVTPDPGVIEVNIHPAADWRTLVQHTEFLYQAAFETRLSAEKFMTDGRHTGTGGGNHLVMGGATPADSPFLRRPELLASLLLYWHNHPSLSYLFSGLFIGPTSQSPRVDEARNDQLYELEIALREIHKARRHYDGGSTVKLAKAETDDDTPDEDPGFMPPWVVDRTLRNILIDITGNTHRAEFCIDKLYSPDSATGRLGLLELRGFEMPPHARMAAAQQLLLRALVSRFWQRPYDAPVTRWGTALHDRFMLPTVLRMDFADVIADLQRAGYAFDAAWFAPQFEFRFPLIGSVQAQNVEMTLRTALEPWHVMGEESSGGGNVRYVDASLERIEVHVTGMNESRHVVTVNGQPVPLQATGVAGEYVAGVRYKAWDQTSALHPTIPVDAPLTFDLVDTWSQHAIGGCVYHVGHPGGRNYTTLPVNAFEAESRRLARFADQGHSPGRIDALPPTAGVPVSREFPYTLDLRRSAAPRPRQP